MLHFLRASFSFISNFCSTLFPAYVLWFHMIKNKFLIIKKMIFGGIWAQYSRKTIFSFFPCTGIFISVKMKNGSKSYLMPMECLETWSECSLRLFCVMKAVRSRKKYENTVFWIFQFISYHAKFNRVDASEFQMFCQILNIWTNTQIVRP